MGRKYNINVELSADDFPLSIEDARNKKPRSGKCRNCGAGLETLYISPNGNVYPCSSMMYYPLGNLNKPYMDVLKNEPAITYRKVAIKYSNMGQERHICRNLSFLEHLQIDPSSNQDVIIDRSNRIREVQNSRKLGCCQQQEHNHQREAHLSLVNSLSTAKRIYPFLGFWTCLLFF